MVVGFVVGAVCVVGTYCCSCRYRVVRSDVVALTLTGGHKLVRVRTTGSNLVSFVVGKNGKKEKERTCVRAIVCKTCLLLCGRRACDRVEDLLEK